MDIVNKVDAGTFTKAECQAIFKKDLKIFEDAVRNSVKVDITQNQFDALVSLAFNIGGGGLARSSIIKLLNAGDVQGAADAFLQFNKQFVGGVLVEAGFLTARRKRERAIFLT